MIMMTPSMKEDYNDDGKPTGSWQTIKHYNLKEEESRMLEKRVL